MAARRQTLNAEYWLEADIRFWRRNYTFLVPASSERVENFSRDFLRHGTTRLYLNKSDHSSVWSNIIPVHILRKTRNFKLRINWQKWYYFRPRLLNNRDPRHLPTVVSVIGQATLRQITAINYVEYTRNASAKTVL
ncbi:hypothetical protein TNCV_1168251 [Trichonephila clavipes]|uniref:Uncharacterized protein n=1 Tax=Trichonephila clavipes TaxID=2585209 RepID=A0A8X6T6V6_TRICX|nr:hypothetical protein TNCV_1168251 [Trichonephila clavipes]